MRRRCRASVTSLAATLAAALAAVAAPASADGPLAATVAGSTDYVLRGVSQTYGGAALQGGVNYQHPGGWFAGAWASNVDPYPGGRKSVEVNAYAGFGWTLAADWIARTSYTRYSYVSDGRRRPYDYGELALAVAFQDRVAATVSYQPDGTGAATAGYARNRPAVSYELSARWPLAGGLALTGGVGYYDLSRLFHARYWAGSAGLGYARGRLRVDLTRFVSEDTVARLYEDATADGRWVLSAAWRF